MPTPQETHALATDMLSQHGLIEQGWKVRWNRRHRIAGETIFSTKTILLSARAVAAYTDAEAVSLILHEIGHALVGPGHKHGPVWRKQVKALGGVADKHCPTFTTGPAAYFTGAASAENLGTVALAIGAAWYVIPVLGMLLAGAAALVAIIAPVWNRRPVLSEAECVQIETAVLNP